MQKEDDRFTVKALQYVAPLLLNCLAESSQDNDSDDDDDVDARKASSTCIGLFSQAVGDAIVPLVETFAMEKFASPNQNLVECAVLAFGSILEGELTEQAVRPVEKILERVVGFLNNPSSEEHLRDTCCWAVGRVAQFFPSVIRNTIQHVIGCLFPNLKQNARVSSQACWVCLSDLLPIPPFESNRIKQKEKLIVVIGTRKKGCPTSGNGL